MKDSKGKQKHVRLEGIRCPSVLCEVRPIETVIQAESKLQRGLR